MSIHLRRPPVATLAIIAGILVLDQITKALVIANIDRLPVDVTSGIRIELVRNTGVSFSLFQSRGWLVTLLVCLVVGTVLVLFLTMPRRYSIPLSVLLGGSLANLIDRFRFGYVVDFVGLWWWPRFNVADIAIILGASLTVLTVLFQPRPRERDDASGGADEADVPDGMGDARTVEPPIGAERKPAHTDGETGAPGSLPRSSADAPSRPSGGKPALSSVEPDDGDPRSGDATVSTRAEGE